MDFFKRFNKPAKPEPEKNTAENKVARITRDISEQEAQCEQLFNAFGKACYDQYTGAGDSGKAQELCQSITDAKARIEALKEALDEANGVRRCPGCGEVLPRAARFCMSCGEKLPELKPVEVPAAAPAPAEPAPEEKPAPAFCPNCGAAREGDAAVCPVCGSGYDAAPAPEAPAEAPAEEPAAEVIAEEVEEAAEEIEDAVEDAIEEGDKAE